MLALSFVFIQNQISFEFAGENFSCTGKIISYPKFTVAIPWLTVAEENVPQFFVEESIKLLSRTYADRKNRCIEAVLTTCSLGESKYGKCHIKPDRNSRTTTTREDRRCVRAVSKASLKRLDIDCIDLYCLCQQRVDTHVPIELTVGEIKKLVEDGKALACSGCQHQSINSPQSSCGPSYNCYSNGMIIMGEGCRG